MKNQIKSILSEEEWKELKRFVLDKLHSLDLTLHSMEWDMRVGKRLERTRTIYITTLSNPAYPIWKEYLRETKDYSITSLTHLTFLNILEEFIPDYEENRER